MAWWNSSTLAAREYRITCAAKRVYNLLITLDAAQRPSTYPSNADNGYIAGKKCTLRLNLTPDNLHYLSEGGGLLILLALEEKYMVDISIHRSGYTAPSRSLPMHHIEIRARDLVHGQLPSPSQGEKQ